MSTPKFTLSIPADGDPFVVGATNRYEHPCSCLSGFHYIGHMIEDESGQEIEIYSAYRCGKCGEDEE